MLFISSRPQCVKGNVESKIIINWYQTAQLPSLFCCCNKLSAICKQNTMKMYIVLVVTLLILLKLLHIFISPFHKSRAIIAYISVQNTATFFRNCWKKQTSIPIETRRLIYRGILAEIPSCSFNQNTEPKLGVKLTHLRLWPLLLTWFNFNPSMDM